METPKRPAAQPGAVADWKISAGCPVCGGELQVRRRPGSARSFCPECKFIGRPQIGKGPFGIHILHPLQVC